MKLASFFIFSAAVHTAAFFYPVAEQTGKNQRQLPVTLVYSTEHRETKPQDKEPRARAPRSIAAPALHKPARQPLPVVHDPGMAAAQQRPAVEATGIAVSPRQESSATTMRQVAHQESLALTPPVNDEEYGDDSIVAAETMLTKATQAISAKPITPVNHVKASYEHTPAPAYPVDARRTGREGRVMVRVLVGTQGQPMQVALSNSSGSASLDRAALEAVRQWKFKPARRNNDAIESWVKVPIEFRLADANAQ